MIRGGTAAATSVAVFMIFVLAGLVFDHTMDSALMRFCAGAVTVLAGMALHMLMGSRAREREQAKSREVHLHLFDDAVSPGLLLTANADCAFGGIVRANRRAMEEFGISAAGVGPRPSLEDLIEGMDDDRQRKVVRELRERGHVSMDVRILGKGEATTPALAAFSIADHIRPGYLLLTIRDMGERAVAAEAVQRRERQIALMSSVTRRLIRHLDEPLVLRELVSSAMEMLEAERGVAGLLRDGQLVLTEARNSTGVLLVEDVVPADTALLRWMREYDTAYVSNDASRSELLPEPFKRRLGNASFVLSPILNGEGVLLGAIMVFEAADGRPFCDDDAIALLGVSVSAGIAIENARVVQQLVDTRERLLEHQDELSRLTGRLAVAEERERRRIAEELHDGIGQSLAVLRMRLRQLALRPDSREIIEHCDALIESAIADTRSLTFQLSPPVLYELGLGPALDWLCERYTAEHGIECVYEEHGEHGRGEHGEYLDLHADARGTLYISARELMFNAIKHAEASRIQVVLTRSADVVVIEVIDDGRGIPSDAEERRHGYGIFGVRERLRSIGGSLTLERMSEGGTRGTIRAERATCAEVEREAG